MSLITLNIEMTSLLARALLFTSGTDLGYRIFVDANEKFISVFVTAFRKSDAPGHMLVNPATDWRIVMQQQ